jgi:transposase
VGYDDLDPQTLLKAAKLLDAENRKLIDMVLELRRELSEAKGKSPFQLALEVEDLQHQLQQRNRALFGDSSERRPRDPKDSAPSPKKQTGHGPTAQPALPNIVVMHELDAADAVCNVCGGHLVEWEGQTEDSEEIESIQRCFAVLQHKRKKYRCKCGGCVETAPGPRKLIPGGRYATSVAVAIAVDKYADHLPLERQAQIMNRQGLVIESQTLWDQIDALAMHLQPAYERLHSYLLSKDVLGADETTWSLLGHRGKASKRWYAWALCADDAVLYRLDESRSAEAARKIIGDFKGTLVSDGYTGYQALKKQGASFRIAHCWAHVRRKFIEAESSAKAQCAEVLDLIGKLYAVERSITGPPQERMAIRHEQSRPIIEQIHRWALSTPSLPQSPLGKAIGYLSSLWQGLVVFLDDPFVTLDNNGVERALRGVVVGRKNHYGSKSVRGTEVAALFYSLIESTKLCGLDPDHYLKTAANAAIDGAKILLPHELAATLGAS